MAKKKDPTLVCRRCSSVVAAGAVCPGCRQVEETPIPILNSYMQHEAYARSPGTPAGDRIAFHYQREHSRACVVPGWVVYRFVDGVSVQTGTDAGKRFFSLYDPTAGDLKGHARVIAILSKAQQWAALRYGARDWVRSASGDYVEREVNDRFPVCRQR
jgi:hypothetical protein